MHGIFFVPFFYNEGKFGMEGSIYHFFFKCMSAVAIIDLLAYHWSMGGFSGGGMYLLFPKEGEKTGWRIPGLKM